MATPSPLHIFKHVNGTQNILNDYHQWLLTAL